jgi:hypothetical protein
VANFFVSETRKNANTFPTPEDESLALIYNYVPTYTGNDGPFPDEETYFFPLV